VAGGWSRDGAVQDQIDASVSDAVDRARQQLPKGESLSDCEECGAGIPVARQHAIIGVRLCVKCQEAIDNQVQESSTLNRRASKDSQLR